MGMKYISRIPALILLALLSFLSACDSNDGSNKPDLLDDNTNTSAGVYSGFWYLQEADTYIAIDNDHNAISYHCSVNNGYLPIEGEELLIEENLLSIQGFAERANTLSLNRLPNVLKLIYIEFPEEAPLVLRKRPGIPLSCSSDTLEVVSVTSKNIESGITAEFTATVDYRFNAFSEIDVDIELIDNQGNILNEDTLVIDEKDAKEGSFSVTMVVNPGNADKFLLRFYTYAVKEGIGEFYSVSGSSKFVDLKLHN